MSEHDPGQYPEQLHNQQGQYSWQGQQSDPQFYGQPYNQQGYGQIYGAHPGYQSPPPPRTPKKSPWPYIAIAALVALVAVGASLLVVLNSGDDKKAAAPVTSQSSDFGASDSSVSSQPDPSDSSAPSSATVPQKQDVDFPKLYDDLVSDYNAKNGNTDAKISPRPSDDALIEGAHRACSSLKSGSTFLDVLYVVRDDLHANLTAAGFFMGVSIETYCPDQDSKIPGS